ncbi:MAG: metallophosphoesterase [Clostridia bacterium]|nr:metallophosphoesterase [Clostridia bacterium]
MRKSLFAVPLTVLFLILLVFFLFWHSNSTVGITKYKVKIEDLPGEFNNYKIVQLSDLHSREWDGFVGKIRKQSPDIVVMTGDMISTDDENFDVFLSYAEEIAKEFTTYFIVGNHEQALHRADLAELTKKLADRGVYVIDNSRVRLEKGDSHINLYGLWFNLRFYRDVNDSSTSDYILSVENVEEILGKPKKGVNILLTHNPVYFDAYAKWGADLTLSGHMHGGMIYVPFKGGLFSPEKEYYPEYDGGYYEKQGSALVVSRGLGEHAGFRLLNQPEIVVITLKK